MDKLELYPGGFPGTTQTFDFMQKAYSDAISALTALGGDTYILKGVLRSGANVSAGAIVYQGEYLPFASGSYSEDVSIFEEVQEVIYNEDADNDGNLDKKRAYVHRYAKCGTGGLTTFKFDTLKPYTPLTKISLPIGTIILWSGALNQIPNGYILCNGSNGTPDLRGQFIVGAGGSYAVGDKGGANQVSLTKRQMPSHNHSGTTNSAGSHKHNGSTTNGGSHSHNYRDGYFIESGAAVQDRFDGYGSERVGTSFSGSNSLDQDNTHIWYKDRTTQPANSHKHNLDMNNAGSHNHSFSTNDQGDGEAHENRPPYFALAYLKWIGL